MMISQIKSAVTELFPELRTIRRHLHAHPELSYQEYETAKFVASELDKIGIPYQAGVADTGIVALIKGKNPDKKMYCA